MQGHAHLFLILQLSYAMIYKGDRNKENKNARQTRVALGEMLRALSDTYNAGVSPANDNLSVRASAC